MFPVIPPALVVPEYTLKKRSTATISLLLLSRVNLAIGAKIVMVELAREPEVVLKSTTCEPNVPVTR